MAKLRLLPSSLSPKHLRPSRQRPLDRLKSETNALLKHPKDLEESGVHGSDRDWNREELVPRASWDVVQAGKLK